MCLFVETIVNNLCSNTEAKTEGKELLTWLWNLW